MEGRRDGGVDWWRDGGDGGMEGGGIGWKVSFISSWPSSWCCVLLEPLHCSFCFLSWSCLAPTLADIASFTLRVLHGFACFKVLYFLHLFFSFPFPFLGAEKG